MNVESKLEEPCVLREFSVESEAELACAVLEQVGVASKVIANHSLGAGLEFGGRGSYRIIVRREDLDTARTVLAQRDEADNGSVLVEGSACPKCGAEEVVASRLSGREVALRKVVRLFVMPWHRKERPEVNPSRRCTECWYRW